jgi:hypothetical protein
MGTVTPYPSGQQLVSSALTVAQINALMVPLTYGMIGLSVTPPGITSPVRDVWPTEGQPFQDANTDVCYVKCVPHDVDYSRVRDKTLSQSGSGDTTVLTETWVYTKGWDIAWTLYGPNSEDRARMIRSALFMDYFNDQLNLSNLYPVPDAPEVTRMPEEWNAQWIERADYHIVMYEQVTETITDGIATSVEVKVFDGSPSDPGADFTVTT